MKIKLYSNGHMHEAKLLFPDQIEDPAWLETQWTDKEINACKELASEEFRHNPTLETYPYPLLALKSSMIFPRYWLLTGICMNIPNIQRFSVLVARGGIRSYGLPGGIRM